MIETIIGKEFPNKVIPLIDQAVKSIDIVVYVWCWYPSDPGAITQIFNQAIIRAVRRGVRVRAITNIDAVVRVLKENGCEAKKLKMSSLVHCKFMVIDEGIVVVGSHNFTQNAFQNNVEVSVIFEDRLAADRLKIFFENLWGL